MKTMMKINRSELFRTAWAVRPDCGSFADALQKAWAAHKLQRAMSRGIVAFMYQKKAGSYRPAAGTLNLLLAA
jgi:hypothetical protein